MKVLLLIHGLDVGGAESIVAHLAHSLRAGGDAVEIGCLGELGQIGEELRGDGIAVHVHPRRTGFDATLPLRLARQVRAGRYDVVHAHQRTALFYGMLAGLGHTSPMVYTEHGPLEVPVASLRQRAFNRVFRRRLSRISAVSDHAARALSVGEGFGGRQITVIPNGIDVGRWRTAADHAERRALRERCGLPSSGAVLGTVGRMHTVKDQALLVRMLAVIRRRRADASLALVGDGPESGTLAALARQHGVADAVYFLGMRRDVDRVVPAFDVFCLSSRWEGIPLTLLEAMAARVPVVAAATGGVPEAARHEREALLVPTAARNGTEASVTERAADVAAFAAAAERLLDDAELRTRLTDAALARVEAHFDIGAVCQRYRQLLASVVA